MTMKNFSKNLLWLPLAIVVILSVAGCAKIDEGGSNAAAAENVAVERIEQDLLAQRRKSGHCTCGGRLKSYWVYKTIPCPSCDGEGGHKINGKWTECTMCHGRKTHRDPVGVEYRCTSCGKRYKNY